MDAKKLVFDLIAIRSYSGQEGEIREYIKRFFEERKIATIVQGENLVVKIAGKNPKKAFVFNSHMDTVNAGNESDWKYGSCVPTMEGEMVVGLGASDMKSGLAASMLLAEKMAVDKPPIDMWFTYVVREEEDGSGSESFANWFKEQGLVENYDEIGGLFTEPTDLREIEYGHRGNIFLRAVATGDSGHASRPKNIKKQAVKIMYEFGLELEKRVEKWAKKYQGDEFDAPSVGSFTSINAGMVVNEGKMKVGSVNKFADVCEATFDLRTVPGFHDEVYQKIVELGEKMGVVVSYLFSPAPSGYTDPKEKIVKVAEKVLGKPKLIVSQGAADLGFLTSIGMKAIIMGPGLKTQCHQTNEMAPLGQIDEAVSVYEKIVYDWSK